MPYPPCPSPARIFRRPTSTLKAFKEARERECLDARMAKAGRDLQGMLDTSGLSRSHLHALLKKHNMTL